MPGYEKELPCTITEKSTPGDAQALEKEQVRETEAGSERKWGKGRAVTGGFSAGNLELEPVTAVSECLSVWDG